MNKHRLNLLTLLLAGTMMGPVLAEQHGNGVEEGARAEERGNERGQSGAQRDERRRDENRTEERERTEARDIEQAQEENRTEERERSEAGDADESRGENDNGKSDRASSEMKDNRGQEKQRERVMSQEQKETGKGSAQGQESRENRRKWWRFWE